VLAQALRVRLFIEDARDVTIGLNSTRIKLFSSMTADDGPWTMVCGLSSMVAFKATTL